MLALVLKECAVGKSIVEICNFGDRLILAEVEKTYAKKRIDKGIAFPTCVSPNNICGHLSPLQGDKSTIAEGDVVKVMLGVQIDGFSALAAHTIVVNSDPAKVNRGPPADAVLASYKALQAALRLMRPGCKNSQITEVIGKVAEAYHVVPLEGVLSHEIKKYLLDGGCCIANRDVFDQKIDEHEFTINQAFVLDVIISTGEGKSK